MIYQYSYWKYNYYWQCNNYRSYVMNMIYYYLINKYMTNNNFFDSKITNLNDISINIALCDTKSYNIQMNVECNAYPTR